jgi:hypothetical protein
MRTKLLAIAAVLAGVSVGRADDGLTKGTPDLKSATKLAFGAKGMLFVGDTQGSAIFAIDTGDTKTASEKPLDIERIDAKVASALGVGEKEVKINDLKVNPASGNVYLAVTRGTGAGQPAIIKIGRDATIEPLTLKDVMFSKIMVPGQEKGKATSFTSMAFMDGRVFVAGQSNEEFQSTLWAFPFPFGEASKGSGIKIYHAAHSKFETQAPIRTFTPYKIGKEESIIASYQCTPLVKIPVSELKPGAKVTGTTIAELGNRNMPLAMISYTKDGKDYLLMSNNARGIMKIPTADFASAQSITTPVKDGATEGIKYEKISELKNVGQLDKLDDTRAVLLVLANGKDQSAGCDIKTVPLP